MLDKLWRRKTKHSQLIKAAKDKDVSIFYLENGECVTVVAEAWLQRAAINQAERKIAYEAYKDFREFGRGAVLISPVEPFTSPASSFEPQLDAVYVAYRSKQQILESRNEVPAEFQLIDDLLLDKLDQYDPENEAVIAFFLLPAVVLIQFKDFQVKPKECYERLAFLETCLSSK